MIGDRDQSILDKTRDTDEPVIVFRAQDRLIGALLDFYRDLATAAGCNPEFMAELVERQEAFADWQSRNVERVKTPD